MGYAHGMRWTDQVVRESIMEVANTFAERRMPSRSEIEDYYGNSALTSRISRTGGTYYWAEVLGLEVKESETKVGLIAERAIKERVSQMGFDVELTGFKHPYDLLVDGCVKVDVKTAHKSKIHGCDVYAYRLAKPQQTCDVYVFCEMDKNEIVKTYVVPSAIISGQVQVEMGIGSTKYEPFCNRFDLIGRMVEFQKSLCEPFV